MELKVWVDGIQRVVCGASYNTTCQDVVIALASAMGRTGRFTLVEKWRDSERPLFPGECPLQALYKWGEYAGEVRFYLVQAAAANVKQKEDLQKWEPQAHKLQASNKYNTPHLPENHLYSPEAESLRRSSTFSGAHRTNYPPVLSTPAVTSSHRSAALLTSKNGQQKTVQSSTALARGQPAGIAAAPKGEWSGLSSSLASDPSSKTSSKLLPYVPATTVSGGLPSGLQPPVRRDARHLHPANMPTAYSSKIKDYASESSFKPSVSSSAVMPSQHRPAQNQRYSQMMAPSSSASTNEMSSTYNILNPTTSHSFPSPQVQHSLSSQQSQSKNPLLQQQQQQQRLKPSSQSQIPSSSSLFEKIPSNSKPYQQRDISVERQAHLSQSATIPSHPLDHSKTVYNNNRTETAQIDTTIHGHHYDNALYSDITTSRHRNQSLHNNPLSHGVLNSSASQDRTTSKGGSHSHFHQKADLVQSATLDRRRAPPKVSDLPTRSYSTGDSSHDHLKYPHQGQAGNLQQLSTVGQQTQAAGNLQQLSTVGQQMWAAGNLQQLSTVGQQTQTAINLQQHPTVGQQKQAPGNLQQLSTVGQQKQAAVDSRLTFVDSALTKHQKPGTDGYNQKTSSFSSAVAHVRSLGDASLHNSLTENIHSRQHILNNIREDHTSDRNTQNSTMVVNSRHVSGEINNRKDTSGTDHQYMLQPLSNKQTVPFSSKPSPQQPSAFTPVSPKPSHQESSLSFPYNSNSVDTSSDDNLIQDLSNSDETSIEIEEYDLDRNFPDIQRRDAAGSWRTTEVHRASMSGKLYLEDGMTLSQSDREYMQLLRIVSVQQERMKTQEALISDADMEISILEEEESSKVAQLAMLAKDISHLEKQEVQQREELEELEKVNWASVQDSEQKREADINLQMKSLKEGLENMEWQIKQRTEEADQISKDIKTEEEQIVDRKRRTEELEKTILSEMSRLKDQLASINQTMADNGQKLKDVEKQILEADVQVKQQEEKVNSLTEKLKEQELTSSGSTRLPEEVSSSPVGVPGTDTHLSVNTLSTTDNGEAILKILEGRLSPRSPENGVDGYNDISSAQHVYKSAMSIKNPNGVWV